MANGELSKSLKRSKEKLDFYGKPIPTGYKKGQYSTYPQAKFTPEGKKSNQGKMHFYDPVDGKPVGAIADIPKSKSEMTPWEKHLKRSGGKSKYFKNEKEFMEFGRKIREKRKKKGK